MTWTVRNTDDHRRTWPTLRHADGRVLVLDPGEEAEVIELPDHEVAHLTVRPTKPPKPPKGDDNTDSDGGK